jgi:hypothetical protein
MVEAYFINKTMIGCTLPIYSEAMTLMCDLSFDNGNTFAKRPIPMYIVDAPLIRELNNTEYYYTFNEQVYIEITGLNLD